MKREQKLPLFLSGTIALAAIWFSFPRLDSNQAKGDQHSPTLVPSRAWMPPPVQLDEVATDRALAKFDPLLLAQIRQAQQSASLIELPAMVTLELRKEEYENLRNAFGSDREDSTSHSGNASATLGKSPEQIQQAYESRRLALQKQAGVIDRIIDRFLDEQTHFGEEDLAHRLRLAPMISIRADPKSLLALASLDAVRHLGGESPAVSLSERTAAQAGFTSALTLNGLDGSGAKIAILEESGIPSVALTGPGKPLKAPLGIFDPDRTDGFNHASNVAAVIWGQHEMFGGLAPGSDPYFASGDTNASRAAATDWCIQQGCSVISMSWGSPAGANDGNLKWFDLYYDWVTEVNRVLVVAAAGNDGNEAGRVIHPAAAYNVLAVGALDGKDPNLWQDDEVAGYSSFVDPNTGTIKPEVVSYGTLIKSVSPAPAFGRVSSGTSFAAPAVAAAAALCIQENPGAVDEPMLLKAQLMASAVSHDLSGTDRDGVGTVMARAYSANTSARTIYRDSAENLEWTVQLEGGKTNRIVLCYSHLPRGGSAPTDSTVVDNGNSYHLIDLDFEVFVGETRIGYGVHGPENPFEFFDYTPATDELATVRIARWNWPDDDPRSSLRIGLAHGTNSNFGTGPDDSNDDVFEPNEDRNSPADLSVHETLNDMRSTDEDWFRISIPPHTTTTVRIEFENETGNLELLAVKADDPSTETRRESSNDWESVEISTGEIREDWLFRVYAYFPDSNRNSYRLTVRSDVPPLAPSPVSPASNEQTSATPTLRCSGAQSATDDSDPATVLSARWQVSLSSSFSNPVIDTQTGNLTTFAIPEAILQEGLSYYWRVRHIDAANRKSPWSPARRFSPVATPDFPTSAPEGLQSSWENDFFSLRWNSVPNAQSYRVYSGNPATAPPPELLKEVSVPEVTLEGSRAGQSAAYWITALNGDTEGDPARVVLSTPPPRVDGMVGPRLSRFIGNNQYSATGADQKTTIRLSRSGRGRFYFASQNDSLASDQFSLRMTRGNRRVSARVQSLSTSAGNITAAITGSAYQTPPTRASGSSYFLAKLKNRTGRARRLFRVIHTSASTSGNPEGIRLDATISRIR